MPSDSKQQKSPFSFDPGQYPHYFKEMEVPAKSILLREGQVSRKAYYINKGCMRLWFNHNGKEISFQFFFEGEAVSSLESFRLRSPSLFNLGTIEDCTLLMISRQNFDLLLREIPGYQEFLLSIQYERLAHYSRLFLSRIRDKPEKRYLDLLKHYPHILQRVPLQHIASYLGITAVPLSRMRKKIHK